MRRILGTFLIGAALLLGSCATVKVTGDARLAPDNAICTKVTEKRYFYLLYGLIPLGNTSTSEIIPRGRKVKVEVKYAVMDVVISALANAFLPTTLISKTAEVYVCE
ncbi:MAG: hypothetical protein GXO39_07735 [Thermotogae bacterium]|nr:hypothetical protein [Thermotogota bacterium]